MAFSKYINTVLNEYSLEKGLINAFAKRIRFNLKRIRFDLKRARCDLKRARFDLKRVRCDLKRVRCDLKRARFILKRARCSLKRARLGKCHVYKRLKPKAVLMVPPFLLKAGSKRPAVKA